MGTLSSVSLVLCLLSLAAAPSLAGPSAVPAFPARAAEKITVYSISPTQAEPGTQVVITADGVNERTRVLLGGDEMPSQNPKAGTLTFMIPQHKTAGQYVLSIKGSNGSQKAYSFKILPLKPELFSLEPAQITSCTAATDPEITVLGRNFTERSQLLLNGMILPSRYVSPESVTFNLPKVSGGLHQVAIKNDQETATPLGLSVVTSPQISSVSIGQDHVNSYELIIYGNNFQQNSLVMIDGMPVDSSGTSPSGRLLSIECSKIIYLRRPFSSTTRELRIQVVATDGEASRIATISAP